MKMLVDARTLGSKPSGIGIYTFQYLKELIKTDCEIILVTDVDSSEEMHYLRERGLKIICYGKSVYRSAQVFHYFAFVKEKLEEIQPELFWEPNILISGSLGKFQGKVMVTIYDMFPVTHVKYFGWKYSLYFRFMLYRTSRKANFVIYDSIEAKKETEHYFPRFSHIPGYVQYAIVPRIEHKKISVQQQNDYFLYVGNMEKRKGVDILLRAYDMYCQNGGKKRLVLAGKKREEDVDNQIKRLMEKYPKVQYCGYVNEKEKQKLYQNCGCFLFPSRAEGFGICVLEAMNYYRPVLVSDLSIFREIVGDCINYFSLDGDMNKQAANLMKEMFEYEKKVNVDIYDQVLARYTPEVLGTKMKNVLMDCKVKEE